MGTPESDAPLSVQFASLISSMLKLKKRIKQNTEDFLKADRANVREIEAEIKSLMAKHDMNRLEVQSHGVVIVRQSKTPASTYKPSDIRTILSEYFGPGGESELNKIWEFVQERRKKEHTEKIETLRAEGHHHRADKISIKKITTPKDAGSLSFAKSSIRKQSRVRRNGIRSMIADIEQ